MSLKRLWKQKMRIDRGMSISPFINMTLLAISASDRIQRWIDIPTSVLVAIVLVGGVTTVWSVGYVMTCKPMREAEDEAIKELVVWRSKIVEKEIE